MSARASVDLPQPDSPTRPSVSPASTSMLTSETACTRARERATGNSTRDVLRAQQQAVGVRRAQVRGAAAGHQATPPPPASSGCAASGSPSGNQQA